MFDALYANRPVLECIFGFFDKVYRVSVVAFAVVAVVRTTQEKEWHVLLYCLC